MNSFLRAITLSIVALLLTACASNDGYRLETLVPGGPLHGAKGISFGPDGGLYVCSVYAQTVYRVDVDTGEVTVAVGPPYGTSDDVAFAPDGTMAWTALPEGKLWVQKPGGEPYVLADKLPLINPVGYTKDGRMYISQIGVDRFMQIDPTGAEAPREVMKGIGHLNSFEITAENQLYGPLAGIGTLARIDLDAETLTPVATELETLSAVELAPDGTIYAIGWDSGRLLRVDEASGEAALVATLTPPLDNLAVNEEAIYISQPAISRIVRVDPDSGEQTIIVDGNLGVPGGLALTTYEGKEALLIADDYAFRWADPVTGETWATADLAEFMDTSSANDIAANDEVIMLSDVTRSVIYMVDRKSGDKLVKWRRMGTNYGVTLNADGNPLYAEFEKGQLIQLDRNDRKARTVIAEGLQGPVDIVWADANSVYVSEATGGSIVLIDVTSGNVTRITEGLDQPEGMTLLADGRLAVVEVGAQQVTAINPATGKATVLAAGLPVNAMLPEAPAPVYTPTGIAAAADGTLLVSSDVDHSILKLVPR
jgi:sugar lactone lactonase YvrE